MLQVFRNSKTNILIYRVALPLSVITLLLGIASFNDRPQLLGSSGADSMIRLLLTAWFCGLYWSLAKFSSFAFYHRPKKEYSTMETVEKIYHIVMSIFFSSMVTIITYWTIKWFLPINPDLTIGITVSNGLLTLFPMLVPHLKSGKH
jgi:hypothetical protein